MASAIAERMVLTAQRKRSDVAHLLPLPFGPITKLLSLHQRPMRLSRTHRRGPGRNSSNEVLMKFSIRMRVIEPTT